jgi:hypothetical protein
MRGIQNWVNTYLPKKNPQWLYFPAVRHGGIRTSRHSYQTVGGLLMKKTKMVYFTIHACVNEARATGHLPSPTNKGRGSAFSIGISFRSCVSQNMITYIESGKRVPNLKLSAHLKKVHETYQAGELKGCKRENMGLSIDLCN